MYEHIDFKNVPLLTLLLEPVILKETYFGIEMKMKNNKNNKKSYVLSACHVPGMVSGVS